MRDEISGRRAGPNDATRSLGGSVLGRIRSRGAESGETRVRRGLMISTRSEGEVTVVAFTGPVRDGDAARLRECFDDLLGSGRRRFVFDFDGLTYIDSTLIAETVSSFKRAKERSGGIRFVSPPGTKVRHVLEITALDRVLEIFDTLDHALESDRHGSSASPIP